MPTVKKSMAQTAGALRGLKGFVYTEKHQREMNKYVRALHKAAFPWVIYYSMDQGESFEDLSVKGKHVILLVKGRLEAENKSRAWMKPFDRVQTLDEATTAQKQLPIRANGKYDLTAEIDSEFYEAHVCLSPSLAKELVEDGGLRFYTEDGKAAANATVVDLLRRTTFERTTKKNQVTVNVNVPNFETSQVSKAIQDWFEAEWDKKTYIKRRTAAKTLDREDLEDLYNADSDDEEKSG